MTERREPESDTIRRMQRAMPPVNGALNHPFPGAPSPMVSIARALLPLLFAIGCLV
jgi:hypothetical protein